MQYHVYETAHLMLAPLRLAARSTKTLLQQSWNPWGGTPIGRHIAAGCEVFENITRRYGKPEFGLKQTVITGMPTSVVENIVFTKPFCDLIHFKRQGPAAENRADPKVLIVAPMSGHYATLLRGTVAAMLPEHEVYITDWADARDVPIVMGRFDLDDYIDYVIEFVHHLGPNTHVMAVCQPSVPVLAAAAVMAANDDPLQPLSVTLMGGPIDTRRNPTVVNKLAMDRPIEWFEQNVVSSVPFPNPGFMRRVYPGFVQLTGFMQMNLERHSSAHYDLFNNLVAGDCDSVKAHQDFYEEYMAVMDLTAEFYLQTVKTVFQDHALPNGTMMHRGQRVDCTAIRKTALITIEGEKDDITGIGQSQAAHDLCSSLPPELRYHYVQSGVGHYGVFNGTRWRTEIQPRVREMIRSVEFQRRTSVTVGRPAIISDQGQLGATAKPEATKVSDAALADAPLAGLTVDASGPATLH